MKFSFTITGEKEILKKLDTVEKKLKGAFVRKALRKAAKLVQAKAKSTAPNSSGTLEENIKVRAMRRSRNRIGYIVSLSASTMPGNWYGNVVEWGRKNRFPFEGRHFLKKAYEQTAEQAKEQILHDLYLIAFGRLS